MDYYIGIDIGTTNIKGLAIDKTGKILTKVSQSNETIQAQKGFYEQNPDKVFHIFVLIVNKVVENIGSSPISIGFSSAMHSIIPVNKVGFALNNAILWSDRRSSTISDELNSDSQAKDLFQNTGTPIHPMSPLCKIKWVKEHLPAIFNETAHFLDIKSYIVYKLTDELFCDYSIASASGLFSLKTKDWYPPAFEFAGISKNQLPKPVPSTHIFQAKNHLKELNISANTKFVMGASDGCLANLGGADFSSKVAYLSTGTSAALRYTSADLQYESSGKIFTYWLDDQKYIIGGGSNNGGNIIQWFHETYAPEIDIADLLNNAESDPSTFENLFFLPWIFGERAPLWDANAKGGFINKQITHTFAQLSKAVLEGIAFNLMHIFELMQKTTTIDINHIHIDGGLARSAVWGQLLADIFDVNINVSEQEDSPARGAVMMSMKALGHIENYIELENWKQIKTIFVPNKMYTDFYKKKYKQYRELVDNRNNLSLHE